MYAVVLALTVALAFAVPLDLALAREDNRLALRLALTVALDFAVALSLALARKN